MIGKGLAGAMLMVAALQPAVAGELNETDAGTYVVMHRDGYPTQVRYRLSRQSDKWLMEGRMGDEDWHDISCDQGCDYRSSQDADVAKWFPETWRNAFAISCIHNVAQAFCRIEAPDQSGSRVYLVLALVTGQPIPLRLARVLE